MEENSRSTEHQRCPSPGEPVRFRRSGAVGIVAGMTWLRVAPFTAELLVWVLERHLDDSRLVRRRIRVEDVMPLAKGDDVLEPISPAEQERLRRAVDEETRRGKEGPWYSGTGNRVGGQGPVIDYGPTAPGEKAEPIADLASLEADRMARAIDRETVGELTVHELSVPALLVDYGGWVRRAVGAHRWTALPCDQPSPYFCGCTVDCRRARIEAQPDQRTVLLFCDAGRVGLPLGRILHHKRDGWIVRDEPGANGMVTIRRRAPEPAAPTKGGEDGE